MPGRVLVVVLTILMLLVGGVLLVGGGALSLAGGSPYYLLAGAAVVAAALGIAIRRAWALPLFGLLLAATLGWAVWEAGLDGWALAPRLIAPALLGLCLLAPAVRRRAGDATPWWIAAPVLAIALTFGIATLQPTTAAGPQAAAPVRAAAAAPDPAQGEWRHWGRTLAGDRFVPLAQIDAGNVAKLELAWAFRSDVAPFGFHSFEATPLAAGGRLYLCLDRDVVVALDQETGEQLWRFDPKTKLDGVFAATCRGVSYYEAPGRVADCPRRILFGAHDGRMLALDAETGRPCRSFGNGGAVSLLENLGETPTGITFPTSPPTVLNGVAVIGGWVTDGLYVGEPSGAVRAYDAVTGQLRWAWDAARPDPSAPLAPGETYARGSPNAWGVFSGDEALGLIYVPTGVTTPDYFGAHRSPAAERYGTSVVALEAATGKVRWAFQTVHHDIWDYDVGAQPVLTDIPRPGGPVPALIQPTKRGQFFVLDRRDGRPIYPVVEKPAPQGAAAGEWTAATQPYSPGFADVAGPALREVDMWGITPLDQLWCRLQFRQARYDGEFTPPGLKKAIAYPGSAGGVNWGSVTIDPARRLMITNSLYMADIARLVPQAEAAKIPPPKPGGHADAFLFPQQGTPYAFQRAVFQSPLRVPCQEPPYGRLSAVDLATGQLVWSQPFGVARHAGPMGVESRLPFRMGVPNLGGSIATGGGLVFIGASQDRSFRAIDIGTGRELWRTPLPSIGAATPMSYLSPKSGRQFVVIAAGGHPGLPGPAGGTLMAYALPAK
ncbi:membrane-bound PQQ-dependent dehydrogenase, glucose/quinate/shikimate family [Phenylobacterium sp. LjRoot219]|uniref:membrane-bound PQQ-dependent dehydrogenase, glucose/quinate/shikimate family n=1 Tax=Phenylobacterium sp. LjRoot219 TaxID=3342283 RepID=UPI003ECE3FAF